MIIVSGKTHQASIWQICKLCGQEYRQTIYIQNIDEELQDPAHKYTAPEGEIIRRDISKRLIRSY